MRSVSLRFWLLAAAMLATASAAILALLASGVSIPSLVRNPLSDFVQPGISIWWLVLGGPFRTIPYSAWGIAFAAAANAASWLLALWIAVVFVRVIQRVLIAHQS